MTAKILAKNNLSAFLRGKVYAPLPKDGKFAWGLVESPDDLVFQFVNSSLSPKSFFLPQTESLMTFVNDPAAQDGFILEPVPLAAETSMLMNMRPCDAKAFSVLDLIFVQDEAATDIYWQHKRRHTALVGLACNDPCPSCFCTSVNCGPHHEEGLDVLAVDLGDKLLLKLVTEKGQALADGLPEASEAELKQADELKAKAEAQIKTNLSTAGIDQKTVLDLYELPLWAKLQDTCLNCGVCTFVCPTCHCFDIQDETTGKHGRRVRNWDYCMSSLFTRHGTGHNPRGRKIDRVRQRFMHKFKYIPQKRGGRIGCVGCGRCVIDCPVNIDVRRVVQEMNA